MGRELNMTDPSQPETARKPSHFRQWSFLLSVGLLPLVLVTMFYLPSEIRSHSALRVKSMNNLEQIRVAIQLYTKENGGHYPDTFGTLLRNEDITASVFVSPGSKDTPATGATPEDIVANLADGGHLSYVYLGRGLTTTTPGNVVVAYENPSIWTTGANVLYADGHVEFQPPDYMAGLTSRAAAGQFPVTMPSVP
jgi:prepilin-type processing-associated H-X9-DG protein